MKYPNLQFITKFLRRHKFKQTRKTIEKKLKFWQHQLGYHYHMDLYTLKVISHLFNEAYPLTRFNYHTPITSSVPPDIDEWSE